MATPTYNPAFINRNPSPAATTGGYQNKLVPGLINQFNNYAQQQPQGYTPANRQPRKKRSTSEPNRVIPPAQRNLTPIPGSRNISVNPGSRVTPGAGGRRGFIPAVGQNLNYSTVGGNYGGYKGSRATRERGEYKAKTAADYDPNIYSQAQIDNFVRRSRKLHDQAAAFEENPQAAMQDPNNQFAKLQKGREDAALGIPSKNSRKQRRAGTTEDLRHLKGNQRSADQQANARQLKQDYLEYKQNPQAAMTQLDAQGRIANRYARLRAGLDRFHQSPYYQAKTAPNTPAGRYMFGGRNMARYTVDTLVSGHARFRELWQIIPRDARVALAPQMASIADQVGLSINKLGDINKRWLKTFAAYPEGQQFLQQLIDDANRLQYATPEQIAEYANELNQEIQLQGVNAQGYFQIQPTDQDQIDTFGTQWLDEAGNPTNNLEDAVFPRGQYNNNTPMLRVMAKSGFNEDGSINGRQLRRLLDLIHAHYAENEEELLFYKDQLIAALEAGDTRAADQIRRDFQTWQANQNAQGATRWSYGRQGIETLTPEEEEARYNTRRQGRVAAGRNIRAYNPQTQQYRARRPRRRTVSPNAGQANAQAQPRRSRRASQVQVEQQQLPIVQQQPQVVAAATPTPRKSAGRPPKSNAQAAYVPTNAGPTVPRYPSRVRTQA